MDSKDRPAGLSVRDSCAEFLGPDALSASARNFGLQFGQQFPHLVLLLLPIASGISQAKRARSPDGGFHMS